MSIRRADRVARELQRELSELIRREVKDPRVGFATISKVELTDDLREATVHVMPLGNVGDEERAKELLEGLRAASGFLQGKAGRNLRLRRTPRLRFIYDAGLENLVRMHDVIEELRADGAMGAPDEEDDA